MNVEGNILVVEPNNGLLTTLEILLKKHFSQVDSVTKLEEMYSVLNSREVDVLILDLGIFIGDSDKKDVVSFLLNLYPETEILLLATFAQVEMALSGVALGAYDYISKPWNNEKLLIAVKNAAMTKKYKKEASRLSVFKEGLQDGGDYFWGSSSVMKKLYNEIHKAAYADVPILLNGECGCGKQQLAKEVHFISKSGKELFVAMDANLCTDDLFMLKLTGRVDTGGSSQEECVGKLELAQNGTLFINNVDRLSKDNQLLLLNIIKSKKFKKINSAISSDISLRFIFGCEADLEKKVLKGEFNEELYNRISDIQVNIPSLRERREDILTLASIFLERHCRKYKKRIKGFTKPAAEFLMNYNWPGNISELSVTIEKAVVLCNMEEISPLYFQSIADQGYKTEDKDKSVGGHVSLLSFIEEETLEQMEIRIIEAVLLRNRGNISLTAHQLGITRQTLYNKMKNRMH